MCIAGLYTFLNHSRVARVIPSRLASNTATTTSQDKLDDPTSLVATKTAAAQGHTPVVNVLEDSIGSGKAKTYQKPLASEVVLILKTGQSTPADRLKAQLSTFASNTYGRSPNNTIIISDAAGSVDAGGITWDILDVINDLTHVEGVADSDKFKIYLEQKASQISGVSTETQDPPGSNNRGWILDALKFIPGYKRAAAQFPEAKWFVGLDDDNYLIWDSLLEFLSLLDSEEKYYIGSPSYMVANGVKFIHGGSVTISSRAAVQARFVEGSAGLDEFNRAAVQFCCGDAILAMAYAASDILPDDRFSQFFNGEPPANTRVTQEKICLPLMGLHHLTGDAIYQLEPHWSSKLVDDRRNKHAFTSWGQYLETVTDAVTNEDDAQMRGDWDFAHMVDNPEKIAVAFAEEKSASICKATCEQHSDSCLAWTFLSEKEECWLSPFATAGQISQDNISGLNLAAIDRYLGTCKDQDWRQSVLDKAAKGMPS